MHKTILVTGANGFIGTHLCNHLANQGHYVIGIDNNKCPSSTKLNKKVKFFDTDLLQMGLIWDSLPDKIHQIYHLASIASPPIYKRYPIDTINVNVNGTQKMCTLARGRGSKLLLASSSEIYGQPTQSPQKESYFGHRNTIGPRSPYDISKAMAETIVNTYRERIGLKAVILRLHNTYGEGMNLNDGRLIPEIIKRAILNEKIIISNDGEQTRCFTYIKDTIDGLIKGMQGVHFGPFNIGNTNEITINEITKMITNMIKTKSKIKYVSYDKDDPRRRIPAIQKAKGLLKWTPKISLNDGLIWTIKDIRGRIAHK